MEEQRYLISDAAKLVAVEAHVLRYWEDELELSIGRTELGHRYYTRENIETFQKIKRLKEEGLQLKAIKVILQRVEQAKCGEHRQQEARPRETRQEKTRQQETRQEETQPQETRQEETRQEETSQEETQPRETQSVSLAVVQSNTKKLQQFKELVEDIVEKVVRENNEELQRRIENSISRETEYLLHMQEQREEERFRRLDEAIRAHQRSSREVAAARERRFLWKWIK